MSYQAESESERGGDSPEFDRDSQAPQIHPYAEGLQVYHEDGLQSPVDRDEKSSYPPINSQPHHYSQSHPHSYPSSSSVPPQAPVKSISKRRLIIIAIIANVIILALALGIGLGVGLKRADTSPSVSATTNTSTPTDTPTRNGILNDTCLTAVMTSEGNRHVVFQDNNGTLRHKVFVLNGQGNAGSWSNAENYLVTDPMPRNNTPIAGLWPLIQDQVHIFFVDEYDRLAGVNFNTGPNTPNLVSSASANLMNGSLAVASGSRMLTMSQFPGLDNETIAQAILYYEAADRPNNITVLQGFLTNSTGVSSWTWHNISEIMDTPLRESGTWLSSPLGSLSVHIPNYSTTNLTVNGTLNYTMRINFFNPDAISNASASPSWYIQYNNWTGLSTDISPSNVEIGENLNSQTLLPNSAAPSVQSSDMISFSWHDASGNFYYGGLAYVQSQRLQSFIDDSSPSPQALDTPYPFARLAWLPSGGQPEASLVYHQLGEGLLVEDAWFPGGGWQSTNISVAVGS